MKYPGQSGLWRTVAIVTIVTLFMFVVIGTVWNTIMPNGFMMRDLVFTENEQSVGSAVMGYDMMDGYSKSFTVSTSGSAGETAATAEQKIIKTAELTISVDGVQASIDAIAAEAVKQNGFVQSSQVYEDVYGNLTGWITIRVPASTFEAVIATIKNSAVRLEGESRNAQDVTEEYTDLEARLIAAEAQESQYLLILEDAATVGEVLAVQEHLGTVRAEIESLQGQINYLTNLTDYSTVTVYVNEETKINFPTEKFDLIRDFKQAGHYVVVLAQKTLTALVWTLVVGLTIAIPVALIGWAGWKIAKRFRRT
ncbi:MAG: hypothetical protein UY72_C0023G0004 [Candidatus Uhrbacteria bacterium GW2011_GWD2_52_7]|uniref:DUF4349 domain-containing protein n=1 Tax=Candidatus Uhrbacteria bacterium GW2011_GWD2_52_7 TaxID=1618989 RepID=A0A0G1ZPJ6_9BACT|nr:MAG: hypothetical protein UY72_C0023G0004 [Candidatus Uhrbacteria bacterium GW2011_GWD2_52_7]